MSVATDTTNDENVSTQKKGNHKGCPYDRGVFSYQSFMSAATDTTNHENVSTQKKGNHKGCSYDGLAGGLFSEE